MCYNKGIKLMPAYHRAHCPVSLFPWYAGKQFPGKGDTGQRVFFIGECVVA